MIKDKRILVTGAGGFIASHIARELYLQGNFVRAVDTKWDDYIQEAYSNEKLTLDLRDKDNCLKVTKDIDLVFNFAANMGGIGYITCVGADVMHDNVLINSHLAKSCAENRIKRILFSSSACIYPTYKQRDARIKPLAEVDAYPADPDNFYGWEKIFTEKMLEAFNRDCGLDIRVVRYHNIYGPQGTYQGGREKSPAALCRKVALALSPGEIEIWGDGKQTRSYCYIDDCVKGTIMLMESDYNRPLNIGSDRLVTIDELADMIIKVSGKTINKRYNLDAPQGVRGRNADLTLCKKVLHWQPEVGLEVGLKNTYLWIQEQVKKEK
jgi:nucleoside-diphosphate-sugar epimerase